jgi:hypothetical protein
MTSPIVFLDIDGVVNSLSSSLVYGDAEWPNPVALGLLARLVHNAEAFVVVSSSWRIGRSPQELRDAFARWNGDGATLASHVIDVTDTGPGPRGAQIARWLAKQPSWRVGAYVILDDDADMLDGQRSRLVQCRHRDGFGVREYVRAMQIIAPGHKDATQLAWYADDRPLSGEAPR